MKIHLQREYCYPPSSQEKGDGRQKLCQHSVSLASLFSLFLLHSQLLSESSFSGLPLWPALALTAFHKSFRLSESPLVMLRQPCSLRNYQVLRTLQCETVFVGMPRPYCVCKFNKIPVNIIKYVPPLEKHDNTAVRHKRTLISKVVLSTT